LKAEDQPLCRFFILFFLSGGRILSQRIGGDILKTCTGDACTPKNQAKLVVDFCFQLTICDIIRSFLNVFVAFNSKNLIVDSLVC
jgi:hypothetical protein